MAVINLFVAEAAPLAGDGGEFVSLVELDVLDGVAQPQLVDTRASDYVSSHFHNGQLVNQLLSIGHVGLRRNLSNNNNCNKSYSRLVLPKTHWVANLRRRSYT